jgi:plastocyanin
VDLEESSEQKCGGGDPNKRWELTSATPLQDWWTAIDSEILGCLAARGALTLAEIGSTLGISEGEATAFPRMLAREGKVRTRKMKVEGGRSVVSVEPSARPGAAPPLGAEGGVLMVTRREFIAVGGLALAGLTAPRPARAAAPVEIHMRNDASRVKTWFDPVGVHIVPGQTLRFILDMDVHSTAAYHPKNAMHCLRIPERAVPWDSGLMMLKGSHFDVTLTVEGVYDYFCLPHEADAMVGRIVVGKPGGPGTLPFDYFNGKPGTEHWLPVPMVARKVFPNIQTIMSRGIVHYA